MSSSLLRVAIALLLLNGGPAGACIHGATGEEQTSTVVGALRVDRLRLQADDKTVVKVFVGPPNLKIGTTFRGVALSAESAKIHEGLAQLAADINSEGSRGSKSAFVFEGTSVSGVLTELTAANYPDWVAVKTKLKVPSRSGSAGAFDDDTLKDWLVALRAAGRSAYALQVEAPTGSSTLLAVQITYPGEAVAPVVTDKLFENVVTAGTPSITWFKDMPNAKLDAAVGTVATLDTGISPENITKRGNSYTYELGDAKADVRTRTWNRVNAATQEKTALTGILWMQSHGW